MNILKLIISFLLISPFCHAQVFQLTSPDKKISITLKNSTELNYQSLWFTRVP